MGLIDVDIRDFLDVPLRYAEGRDLLCAIGASTVPIPPNLVESNPPPPRNKQPLKPVTLRTKKPKQAHPSCAGPSKPVAPTKATTRSAKARALEPISEVSRNHHRGQAQAQLTDPVPLAAIDLGANDEIYLDEVDLLDRRDPEV